MHLLKLTSIVLLLCLQAVNGEAVQTRPQDFIKLQSYLNSAKRAAEFNDNRNAFNYYQRILDIDWQYENIIDDYLAAAIKSGAVKEAETALLKIYAAYRNQKINLLSDPALSINRALAIFYLSTGRDQIAEEFITAITKSALKESDKITIHSDLYNRGGKTEAALSVLENGRKKIKSSEAFAWQFYQLHFKKSDYFPAGLELTNHFSNLLKESNPAVNKESFQEAEAELTKVVELSSEDELKKIIQLLESKSVKNGYFYKLLSALYFNLKDYDKAYQAFKKAPADNLDDNQNSLIFARELQDENEIEFALAYYEKFFSNSSNIPTSQSDFFNYLRLIFASEDTQRGLSMMESSTLPQLVNPVLLDLFKAEIYFYQLKQPRTAEKISEKYFQGNDLPAILAKKIRRDLAVFRSDYLTATALSEDIRHSGLSRSNPVLQQECRYADCLLTLLKTDQETFKTRVIETARLKSGSDSDNDLLKIIQFSQQASDQATDMRKIAAYSAFRLHKQPTPLLDSIRTAARVKDISTLEKQLLFDYLNDIAPREAELMVAEMLKNGEISDFLPEMIFKTVQRNIKKTVNMSQNETNLLYLIKNYPKSLYLEPSRKLLRKLTSRKANGS